MQMFPSVRFNANFDELRSLSETAFKHLPEDDILCHRILVEAIYEAALEQELLEIEEVRKQESLKIPNSIDYFKESLNMSLEERSKLSLAKPQTVRFIYIFKIP